MSLDSALSRVTLIQARISVLTGSASPATVAQTPPPPAATSFGTALATAQATAALPPAAAGLLTPGQQQFVARLAAQTGLDPKVVTAWALAEESGDAARTRQAANNNNWLNIGYTDSATYGAGAAVWSDPAAAADATAGWLKGESTVPGYGQASSGVRAILTTVGLGPDAQIQALRGSGWASGGYPSLAEIYRQVGG